jgi:hypothetical protein
MSSTYDFSGSADSADCEDSDRVCPSCSAKTEQWWSYCAMCGHHIAAGIYLTEKDVLGAHTQFGGLDWKMVEKAMGPNWPALWASQGPGQGIFAPEEDRSF